MDPNACYREILSILDDKITEDDIDRLRELTDSLSDWIGKGGFLPSVFKDATIFKDGGRCALTRILDAIQFRWCR